MEIKSKENVYNGFFGMDKLTIETGNGEIITREVLVKQNAVAGLVYDTVKKKYIFVQQFRAGVEGQSIEIVAGTMDVPGEEKENTMAREIEEEIGYKVDKIEHIMTVQTAPAYTAEKMELFYCEVSEKVSEGGGVGDEDIKIIEADDVGSNGKLIMYDSEDIMKETIQLTDPKSLITISWKENKDLMKNVMDKVMDISDYVTSSKLRSL